MFTGGQLFQSEKRNCLHTEDPRDMSTHSSLITSFTVLNSQNSSSKKAVKLYS